MHCLNSRHSANSTIHATKLKQRKLSSRFIPKWSCSTFLQASPSLVLNKNFLATALTRIRLDLYVFRRTLAWIYFGICLPLLRAETCYAVSLILEWARIFVEIPSKNWNGFYNIEQNGSSIVYGYAVRDLHIAALGRRSILGLQNIGSSRCLQIELVGPSVDDQQYR